MSVPMDPSASVGACALCGGPDPLDLAVCLGCTSRTGDGSIFLRRPLKANERARIARQLHGLLPAGAHVEAFRLAASGYAPLASVPVSAAEQVLAALTHEGVPTHIIPRHFGVAPLPPGIKLLLVTVLIVGSLVGLVAGPVLLLMSPVYAGLLWVLAQLHLRTPATQGHRSPRWLPEDVERRVVRTLVGLPAGPARTLLADAVHLARLLWERAVTTDTATMVEDTPQLLSIAAEIANDLARVEEAGRVVASQRAEGATAHVTRTEALESIEVSRQRLHDQLLEVVRAMGGANRGVSAAGSRRAELQRLAGSIDASRSAQAQGAAEVERLLA